MDEASERERIEAALRALAERRGAGRTFCPSEAARAVAADWRPLMSRVRAVAADLVERGTLTATQGGREVDPRTARGPIRLAARGNAG